MTKTALTPCKRALRWAESGSRGSECASDPRQTTGWSPKVGHWQYALGLNLAISPRVVEPWRDMHFMCVLVFAASPTHPVVAL
jgi:hypothetical protein